MPQNIVVGDEAEAVADFVAAYAGSDVDRPPRPGSEGAQTASEEELDAADESQVESDLDGEQ
jgi:hypothetical protein